MGEQLGAEQVAGLLSGVDVQGLVKNFTGTVGHLIDILNFVAALPGPQQAFAKEAVAVLTEVNKLVAEL